MVLNEPAPRFYQFLEHALIIEAEKQYTNLNSMLFPHLSQTDRQKQLQFYRNIFEEIEQKTTGEGHGIVEDRNRLRKLLKKK